jgi:excisionase family DNA binding protein
MVEGTVAGKMASEGWTSASRQRPEKALPHWGRQAMPRTKPKRDVVARPPAGNGPAAEVLTLSEAAAYLRLDEPEVVRLVRDQGLPARQIGTEWRFFKTAAQRWLSQPLSQPKAEGIWAAAGSWKDAPYLDDLLQEIYRRRGRRWPKVAGAICSSPASAWRTGPRWSRAT